MPQLGLTMTEGTVTKWFKAVGDTVAVGEVLVEVATDKITNQLESNLAGVLLEIIVDEGATAPVQAAIAIIGQPGEKVAITTKATPVVTEVLQTTLTEAAKTSDTFSAAVRVDGRIKASPYAKKLAATQNIDLSVVTGTGPGGRIIERDIREYSAQAPQKASPLAVKVAAEHQVNLAEIQKETRIMKADVLAVATKPATAAKPLSGIRKVIAERMALSWKTAPHVHLTVEVDMTAALELKENLAKATGKKASVTEVVVKCAAYALREFPVVNASLLDNRIVMHEAVNIGIAVALDDGLIVPVLRNADQKSLSQLREAIVSLGGKSRSGKLLPDEISGGTFTVTNLGMFGTDHFTPVINPPESAILGVCRIVEKPVVQAGAIVIRPMSNFILGLDHRLIDGAVGAQFMARLRELLENPSLLII
jgi:pyruvate dehydrogenase E2 component (dihydrolipoamide acetyltransferase)